MGEFEKRYTEQRYNELSDETDKMILDSLNEKLKLDEQIKLINKILPNLELLKNILREHPEYNIDLRKYPDVYETMKLNQLMRKYPELKQKG